MRAIAPLLAFCKAPGVVDRNLATCLFQYFTGQGQSVVFANFDTTTRKFEVVAFGDVNYGKLLIKGIDQLSADG
jgi:hypothetical protein